MTLVCEIFAIPKNEELALIDIYHSLDGDNWLNNKNWLKPDIDPCTWYGIKCSSSSSSETMRVSQITLNSNNLNGIIPQSIGNFSELMFLCLEWNKNIRGSIPDTIGFLKNAVLITMPDNSIEGAIPESITLLENLQILHLGGNQIQRLPKNLKKMVNLQSLGVEGDRLEYVPDEGPPYIVQHQFGWNCDLSNNNFKCPIPEWSKKDCRATCTD